MDCNGKPALISVPRGSRTVNKQSKIFPAESKSQRLSNTRHMLDKLTHIHTALVTHILAHKDHPSLSMKAFLAP